MQSFIEVNHVTTSARDNALSDSSNVSLSAPPKSDIYAAPGPPELHVFTAPIICKRIGKKSFKLARTTVSASWLLQFDQGGILLAIPAIKNPNPDELNAGDPDSHPAWVKVGVEVNDGLPYLSIVGKARNGWCDWSLVPMQCQIGQIVAVTVELTRFKNALMIWMVKGTQRVLVRKVPWVFIDHGDLGDDILIGLFAARPDPENKSGGHSLKVTFRNSDFEEII